MGTAFQSVSQWSFCRCCVQPCRISPHSQTFDSVLWQMSFWCWQSVWSHVSWLSVTEVVLAFNPVAFQREWIFPVPSALIKITLSITIGPWWNLEDYMNLTLISLGPCIDLPTVRPFDLLGLSQEALVPPNQQFVDQSKLPWGVHGEDWPTVEALRGETGPDWQTHSLAPALDNLRVLPCLMSHGH